jgi:SAM-dependent methyltransferase
LRFWNRVSYPAWTNLEKAIRTGQAQATVTWPEETQRIVSEGVAASQAAPSEALPSTYDFGRHRRILDLGGGTGSWLRAILRQYSNLEGTLFELPPTATVARQHLASDPATRQVKVVEGDLFKDPIPAGHDVVLIANVMHLLSAERNLVLLRLTRQCVPDGGRLLLADYWTDATHTQPAFAALMAGEFLVGTGEGDVYSEEEARRWLQETGWRALRKSAVGRTLSGTRSPSPAAAVPRAWRESSPRPPLADYGRVSRRSESLLPTIAGKSLFRNTISAALEPDQGTGLQARLAPFRGAPKDSEDEKDRTRIICIEHSKYPTPATIPMVER